MFISYESYDELRKAWNECLEARNHHSPERSVKDEALFNVVASSLNEIEDSAEVQSQEDVDELKEHEDFANDGYFENQEPTEDGYWS